MTTKRSIIFQSFFAGYWFARMFHEGFTVFRLIGLVLSICLLLAETIADLKEEAA